MPAFCLDNDSYLESRGLSDEDFVHSFGPAVHARAFVETVDACFDSLLASLRRGDPQAMQPVETMSEGLGDP